MMKLGFCSAKKTASVALLWLERSGCTDLVQNVRCYKKQTHRGLWTQRVLLINDEKTEGETFQFPVPCPHSASNHAHRPLFCSSLLLLSFLPLKCLLYQERRTPSFSQRARGEVRTWDCGGLHSWVGRDGSWWPLPASPCRKEVPRKRTLEL